MKVSKAQHRALEFFDYSERDPSRLFGVNPPATVTTNWLVMMCLVERTEVGQFDFRSYRLTAQGRDKLASYVPVKPRRKRHAQIVQGDARRSA